MKHDNPLLNRWKKPNSLAKPFETAHHIFSNMSEQQKMLVILDAKIKPVFQKHASMTVHVANYEAGQLAIAAESYTAVNHLNYLHSMFLQHLRTIPELAEMTDLKFIYIKQPTPRLASNQVMPVNINQESRRLLRSAASIIRDNPALSDALRHLSEEK